MAGGLGLPFPVTNESRHDIRIVKFGSTDQIKSKSCYGRCTVVEVCAREKQSSSQMNRRAVQEGRELRSNIYKHPGRGWMFRAGRRIATFSIRWRQ